ncbi:MAG: hypothetical protein WAV07_01910 [Candidatus Contendobacter sp.]
MNLSLVGFGKLPHLHLSAKVLFDPGEATRHQPATQIIRRAPDTAEAVILENIQRVLKSVA